MRTHPISTLIHVAPHLTHVLRRHLLLIQTLLDRPGRIVHRTAIDTALEQTLSPLFDFVQTLLCERHRRALRPENSQNLSRPCHRPTRGRSPLIDRQRRRFSGHAFFGNEPVFSPPLLSFRLCRRPHPIPLAHHAASGLRRFCTRRHTPLRHTPAGKSYSRPGPSQKSGRNDVAGYLKRSAKKEQTAEITKTRRNKQHSAELVAFRKIWKVLMLGCKAPAHWQARATLLVR